MVRPGIRAIVYFLSCAWPGRMPATVTEAARAKPAAALRIERRFICFLPLDELFLDGGPFKPARADPTAAIVATAQKDRQAIF